jgi:peptidyl-prolyl cis-trans isomerase D
MAVIGKIRDKSTLLLIFIGGALLAFLLGDALSSRMSFFGNERKALGEIDGVEISGAEFDARVQAEINAYKEREQTSELPEQLASQIREQVWNEYLQERILGLEFKELGLVVTSKELADMTYGTNPHPQVRQAFTNPQTGEFNSSDVVRFIKNLDADETGKTKEQWLKFEGAIKKQRLLNKYNILIQKGLYVTSTEAQKDFVNTNEKMNINYVFKPYGSVPDSAITVTDAEIKAYYKNNQHEFKQERVRAVQYVNFHIVPSQKDSLETKQWVDETFVKFRNTQNDSMFVSVNSDKEFDRTLYSRNRLPAGVDTTWMDRDSVGYMEGPYLEEDGTYKMTKLTKVKYAPDSVRARHIVISFQRMEKDSAMAKIDSIKQALENGADFAELALQYSDDQTSRADSGNLGWFMEGVMLQSINDTCFSAKVGEYKVVESIVGAHVFEVLDRSPVVKKIQLATIERKIEPSRETYDDYFIKANQFSIKLEEEGVLMEDLAAELGKIALIVNVKETDNEVQGLIGSREIIRWAYTAEEGDVSEPFTTDANVVVAVLKEAREEGIAKFDRVKDQARLGAIKEKKAEQFTATLSGKDIESIATQSGLAIQKAAGISFSSFSIPRIGFEPELLGKLFSLKEGDLSRPIKGRNGVYVVEVESVVPAPDQVDLNQARNQLAQNRKARVNYEVFEALKKNANVQDNRYLFY